MTACGFADAVMSRRQVWKTPVVALVFGVPLTSLYFAFKLSTEHKVFSSFLWMEWLVSSFRDPHAGTLAVVIALFIYPLAWWLLVSRRSGRWACGVITAFALLLPWLSFPEARLKTSIASPVSWGIQIEAAREEPTSVGEGALPDSRKFPFELKGLSLGLVVNLEMSASSRSDMHLRLRSIGRSGVRGKKASHGAGDQEILLPGSVSSVGIDASGKLVWGLAAQLSALEANLPTGIHVKPWSNDLRFWSERPVVVNQAADHPMTELELSGVAAMGWDVETKVQGFTDPIIFDLAKGGSMSVPQGGRITLSPLSDSTGQPEVVLDYRTDRPWQTPWNGSNQADLEHLPVLLIVDDVSGEAWWVSGSTEWEFWDHVFLGQNFRFRYPMRTLAGEIYHPGDSADLNKRLAALPHCRAFVFWRTLKGASRQHLDAIEPSH